MIIRFTTYQVTKSFFAAHCDAHCEIAQTPSDGAPRRTDVCKPAQPSPTEKFVGGWRGKSLIVNHPERIFKPDPFSHTTCRCLAVRRRWRFLYAQSWPLPRAGRSRYPRSAA